MIVGTAGHIDHGKTALVKALTGVDADRLAEEKARGITIDLGYAYTPLPGGDILGFVDVPGHEKFIHNMLAGATGIDFALLVVAADDGPMPQTLEHLQILDLLGLRQGAVALTKTDLVDADRIAQVTGDIHALLAGTGLEGRPLFPVSAVTGFGVAELRAHLEAAALSLGARTLRGGFRLAVDRCFTVAGAGTVVTGTVFSGRVAVGDKLLLAPSGQPVRVRGIHAQNRAAETGLAGQRCALNLADVEKREVQRGDWVLAPELHLPTQRLDVRLTLLASETRPLKHWTPVHVHLGAFHAMGRVALLRDAPLEPGGSALAQLVLDQPTCAVNGDRCILRDASARRTLAGGRVLDAQPPARGRRTAQRLETLSAWEEADPRAMLPALLAVSPHGVDLSGFAANANLTSGELDELRQSLVVRCIEGARPVAFAPEHWTRLCLTIIEILRKEHEEVPDSLGLNAEQLRLRTAPRLERAAFAEVLAELLEAGQCAREGSWWHLPGHEITLTEQDEALWQRIAPLLLAQAFQPPRVRDIARAESLEEAAVRKLLVRAARLGRVYRVAHDHYFDRAAVTALADIVRELAREAPDGAVPAARFRDRIGTGRKLAIHILEYFDRIGLTRRLRDTHRLRNDLLQF
jgi:selenocysteine-specific elongation factor